MAKKQKRRSISFERQLAVLAFDRAKVLGQSTSHYISELVRRDLLAAGIVPPATPVHMKIEGVHADGRLRRTQVGFVPKVKHSRPGRPRKEEAPMLGQFREPPKPPKPEAPSCWWCRKGFATHETAVNAGGKILHARCIKEARL